MPATPKPLDSTLQLFLDSPYFQSKFSWFWVHFSLTFFNLIFLAAWPNVFTAGLKFRTHVSYVSQPHLLWQFRQALSKLRAQSSNDSFHWNVAKGTFGLWVLSFETAFENVTPSEIVCTLRESPVSSCLERKNYLITAHHLYVFLNSREGEQCRGYVNKQVRRFRQGWGQLYGNSFRVCGGGVGAEGMVKRCARPRGPGTNTKRSQVAFAVTFVVLSFGHLEPRLLTVPVQSLIETSGTLV